MKLLLLFAFSLFLGVAIIWEFETEIRKFFADQAQKLKEAQEPTPTMENSIQRSILADILTEEEIEEMIRHVSEFYSSIFPIEALLTDAELLSLLDYLLEEVADTSLDSKESVEEYLLKRIFQLISEIASGGGLLLGGPESWEHHKDMQQVMAKLRENTKAFKTMAAPFWEIYDKFKRRLDKVQKHLNE